MQVWPRLEAQRSSSHRHYQRNYLFRAKKTVQHTFNKEKAIAGGIFSKYCEISQSPVYTSNTITSQRQSYKSSKVNSTPEGVNTMTRIRLISLQRARIQPPRGIQEFVKF